MATFPVIRGTSNKVYGSWKNGEDIYRNTRGFYYLSWNPKTDETVKKYLPKREQQIYKKRVELTRKKKQIGRKTRRKSNRN